MRHWVRVRLCDSTGEGLGQVLWWSLHELVRLCLVHNDLNRLHLTTHRLMLLRYEQWLISLGDKI